MANRTVAVNFVANTAPYVAGVGAASKATAGLTTAATAAIARIVGPAALVYGLSQAAKASLEFEDEMTKLKTQIGLTNPEIEQMRRAALSLGGETTKAPQELAEATFFIASAGLRGAAAMDVLRSSAQLSAIGLGDTKTIADLLTSAVNAYGEETLSAAAASDVLVNAVRLGKLEADQLAGAMGRVLPIASAMGVSFDEVGGMMAAMSKTGTDASTAATQLRAIMVSLLKPTNQSVEALHGVGLTAEGLRATIQDDGLWAALMQLHEATDGNADAFAEIFPNVRALAGVMDLLGPQLEGNAELMAQMAQSAGVASDAFDAFSRTTRAELNRTGAEFKRVQITVGDSTTGIIHSVSNVLRVSLQAMGDAIERGDNAAGLTQRITGSLVESLRTVQEETRGLAGADREAALESDRLQQQLDNITEQYSRLTLAEQGSAFTKEVRMGLLRGEIGLNEELTNEFIRQATRLALLSDEQSGANASVDRWNGIAAEYAKSTGDMTTSMDDLAASLGFTREEMELLTQEIDEQRKAQLALIDPVYGAVRAERELRDAHNELAEAGERLIAIPLEQAAARAALTSAQGAGAAAAHTLAAAEAEVARLEEAGIKRGDEYRAAQDALREAKRLNNEVTGRASSAQDTLNKLTVEAAEINDRLVDAVFDVMSAEIERTAAMEHAGLVTGGFIDSLNNTIESLGLSDEATARVVGRLRDLGIEIDLQNGKVVETTHIHTQRTIFETVTLGAHSGQSMVTTPGQVEFRARGGPISAGRPYIVGEEGPELVIPSGSGMVLPAGQTQSLMSGSTYNVTVNMPPGADGDQVVSALRRWERSNGPVPVGVR